MKTIDVTLIPQGKYYISQFDETDVMVDNQIEARTVNPEFAQLIAEAGTVANETGLTPRELLEQRNNFAKLCEAALPELTETLAEVGHDLSVGIDSTRLIMIIDDITEALDGLKNQDK